MFKKYEQEVENNAELKQRQQDLVRRISKISLPSARNVLSSFNTVPPIPTAGYAQIAPIGKMVTEKPWLDGDPLFSPETAVMRHFQHINSQMKQNIDLGSNPLIVTVQLISSAKFSQTAIDTLLKNLRLTADIEDERSFEILMFNSSAKSCMKLKFQKYEADWQSTDIVLFVIDISERSSYQEFSERFSVDEMKVIVDKKIPSILLLAYSPSDASKRCVPQSTMTILATRLRATYLELFTVSSDGIADLLDTLACLGVDRKASLTSESNEDPIKSSELIEKRCLLMGLDASGKTTILYKLKLDEVMTTIPTIGFNVESIVIDNVIMTIWDVGGQDKIRALWRHYYQNTDALIYVVDANDKIRISENRETLKNIINDFDENYNGHEMLIWILVNKSDLHNALTMEECSRALGLQENLQLKERCRLFRICAYSGEGLHEAFHQLSMSLSKNSLSKTTETVINDSQSTIENSNEINTKLKRIILAGLDNSGKTTMLYRLKLGITIYPSSTLGYNIENLNFMGHDLEISDLGGQTALRTHWINYVDKTVDGLIFVIDSVAKERLDEASIEIKRLLRRSGLSSNAPMVVLANKQDLPGALLSQEIQMSLNLFHICRGRLWMCKESSCTNGKGLWESLHWLLTAIGGEELIVENDVEYPRANLTNVSKFKVVIVGPSGSGKSCLMARMKGESFTTNYISTIGVEFSTLNVQHASYVGTGKLQLWDISGQERFASLAPTYIRGANCALLVYDVNQPAQLQDSIFVRQLDSTLSVFLVGCFVDKAEKKTSSLKESQIQLVNTLGGLSIKKNNLHLISNFSGEGINELMKNLSEHLFATASSDNIDLVSIIKTKSFAHKN